MSAMRFFQNVLHRAYVTVYGSFAPNASSAVASSSVRGEGFTVARTAAGTFTITFADKMVELVNMTASLQLSSGDDKVLQFGDYTAADKTLVLRVWDISDGAEADIAADANNRISFAATFRYGS